MTDARARRGWRWLAWLWLAVVLAVGAHQVRFWSESRLESDVLALLPQDAHDPVLAEATRRIADASARQMVVLLGAAFDHAARFTFLGACGIALNCAGAAPASA